MNWFFDEHDTPSGNIALCQKHGLKLHVPCGRCGRYEYQSHTRLFELYGEMDEEEWYKCVSCGAWFDGFENWHDEKPDDYADYDEWEEHFPSVAAHEAWRSFVEINELHSKLSSIAYRRDERLTKAAHGWPFST